MRPSPANLPNAQHNFINIYEDSPGHIIIFPCVSISSPVGNKRLVAYVVFVSTELRRWSWSVMSSGLPYALMLMLCIFSFTFYLMADVWLFPFWSSWHQKGCVLRKGSPALVNLVSRMLLSSGKARRTRAECVSDWELTHVTHELLININCEQLLGGTGTVVQHVVLMPYSSRLLSPDFSIRACFTWDVWFPPTLRKPAGRWMGFAKLHPSASGCAWCTMMNRFLIQGVFSCLKRSRDCLLTRVNSLKTNELTLDGLFWLLAMHWHFGLKLKMTDILSFHLRQYFFIAGSRNS